VHLGTRAGSATSNDAGSHLLRVGAFPSHRRLLVKSQSNNQFTDDDTDVADARVHDR
jgi:hypothetical protein